jgi:hypothetical protein
MVEEKSSHFSPWFLIAKVETALRQRFASSPDAALRCMFTICRKKRWSFNQAR